MKLEDQLDFGVNIASAAIIAAGTIYLSNSSLLVVGLFTGFFLLAGCTLYNQYYDYKVDILNKPSRAIPSGRLKPQWVLEISFLCWLLSLILAIYLGIIQTITVLVGIIIGYLYSHPSSKISKDRVTGLLLLTFGYVVLSFAIGWPIYNNLINLPYLYMAFLFFTDIGAGTIKDYYDYEGDKKLGFKTLPTIYGYVKAAKINAILYISPFLLMLILSAIGYLKPTFILVGSYFPLTSIVAFSFLMGGYNKKLAKRAYWIMTTNIILLRVVITWAFLHP